MQTTTTSRGPADTGAAARAPAASKAGLGQWSRELVRSKTSSGTGSTFSSCSGGAMEMTRHDDDDDVDDDDDDDDDDADADDDADDDDDDAADNRRFDVADRPVHRSRCHCADTVSTIGMAAVAAAGAALTEDGAPPTPLPLLPPSLLVQRQRG